MLASSYFIRTGCHLALIATFFIAVAIHLLHPALHTNKSRQDHCVHERGIHQTHLKSVTESKKCPICSFLASFHLSGLPRVTLPEGYHGVAGEVDPLTLPMSPKPGDITFDARAPPSYAHLRDSCNTQNKYSLIFEVKRKRCVFVLAYRYA